jgi:ParB family chromosome partitioning protein
VVQAALRAGEISEGHARCLLALPTPQGQSAALQTVLSQSLNVRQTEELVRRLGGQKRDAARPAPPPEIAALEERLRASLGTKVSLKRTARGGSLVIHFYSDEELDALIAQITHSQSE